MAKKEGDRLAELEAVLGELKNELAETKTALQDERDSRELEQLDHEERMKDLQAQLTKRAAAEKEAHGMGKSFRSSQAQQAFDERMALRREASRQIQAREAARLGPLVTVKFRKNWRQYYAGRRSYGLPKSLAERLIKAGICYPLAKAAEVEAKKGPNTPPWQKKAAEEKAAKEKAAAEQKKDSAE